MTLSEYLKTMDKEGLDGLARRCGTSVGQLKQVAYGNRRASAGLAVSLDRETEGKISCESLRPDIDWDYLRQGKH
ncbi:helix-turn-helix domain-containing protein [Pseudomonas kurunegalensis]|uniref:transcriptional regulator n=1 Tax=Pseudomonas kurunegalensis TaxID=485880 RepID=UPI001CDCA4B8|nr:YdaS family helix-turn-helix protein [Pseudomonas kurunegalensis]MCA4074593.1 helix-turn-helix domain-containing protein [Pseudomonas kurunegalensis]